jgi:predicted component of type VI protein secretion system
MADEKDKTPNTDKVEISKEDQNKLQQLALKLKQGEPFEKAAFNQLFKDNTAVFLENLANSQLTIAPHNMFNIPKEVVEMDDILTQQMISTYRKEIAPLVIKTQKAQSFN